MVEPTATLEGLEKYVELLKTSKGKEVEILKGFQALGMSGDQISNAFARAGKSTTDLHLAFVKLNAESAKIQLQQPLEALGDAGIRAKEIFDGLTSSVDNLVTRGALFGLAIAGPKILDQKFVELTSHATDAAMQMDNVGAKLTQLGEIPGVGKLAAALKLPIQFAETGETMKNMENLMIKQSAAAGDLGNFMNSLGGSFASLDDKLVQFSTLTMNVGNATGMASSAIAKYYTDMQAIPGVLDQMVSGLGDAAGSMNMLEATIKVARGSGQDVGKVIEDLATYYEELGIKGQEALEVLARTNVLAQKLNMPMAGMKKFVSDAAIQFRYLGDNAQGAITVMARMAPAMKDFGLGPKAIQDMVTGFTQGISKMDVAQKAFVSSTTGGAGGLRGAYEIDLKLKDGKLNEVFAQVGESLKQQMGGQLVTLQEAAGSEEGAAQMTKQVQILQSGPLGGMIQSQEQAYAMMESLIKGGGLGEAMPEPDEALKSTIQLGNDITERQMTELVEVNNKLSFIGEMAAITAQQAVRKTIGTENDVMKRYLDSMVRNARESATISKPISGVTEAEGRTDISAAVAGMVDSLDPILEKISGAFGSKKEEKAGTTPGPQAGTTAAIQAAGTAGPATPEATVTGAVNSAAATTAAAGGGGGGDIRRAGVGGTTAGAPAGPQGIYKIDVVCSGCNKKLWQATADQIRDVEVRAQDRLDESNGTT